MRSQSYPYTSIKLTEINILNINHQSNMD